MKLAVISDLHMGLNDLTDQFKHDTYQFLQFLKYLESNFERIILLGDVWETLFKIDQVGSLHKSFEIYQEIFKRFQGNKYVYIYGNHDLVNAHYLKAPEDLVIEQN